MNFGSKYVYYYQKSDSESVSDNSESDDDFGLDGFGLARPQSRRVSSGLRTAGPMPMMSFDGPAPALASRVEFDSPSKPRTEKKKKKRKKVRKSDPNLFTLDISKYCAPSADIHPNSKMVICSNCKAVMTSVSTLQDGNSWICDFCGTPNLDLQLEGFTKPKSDDITFLLKKPEVVAAKDKAGENHNVIFVIDISGSMGTTKEMNHIDANGRHTRTYVSRLDAVKKAAEFQIRQLKDESPNIKVGLVAFGSNVEMYGDCHSEMVEFKRDVLNDTNQLTRKAEDLKNLKPISKTFDKVIKTLNKLDVRGNTALGPGLWSALVMASSVKGSKVIICTDGCANNGIGTLPDDYADELEITACRDVYKGFGNYAKDNNITVSVISMEGTDCKLVHLGTVAQMTGGTVDIVNQANLNDQFGNILTSRTVAVDVMVYLCLHHSLYIRDRDNLAVQSSTKQDQLGNVTEGMDMVVEFGVKTVSNENEAPMDISEEDQQTGTLAAGMAEAPAAAGMAEAAEGKFDFDGPQKSLPVSAENVFVQNITGEEVSSSSSQQPSSSQPSKLPFQVQVKFTTRGGEEYLRAVTIIRECTDQRAKAEHEMDLDVVGAATSKTVSEMGLAGQYENAMFALKAKKNMSVRRKIQPQCDSLEFEVEALGNDTDDEYYMDDLSDLQGVLSEQRRVTKAQLAAAPTSKSESAYSHYVSDSVANVYYDRTNKAMQKFQKRKASKK